ncbi:MAG: hypothetical protein AUK08_01840 [Candidatus Pacebacteria bacterium CG2_30_36_39]|nr:MAG: hypothetical protein AUK08_01840 [Candidatus Pacebacteria bacterium CG2_30_36_39]
MSSQEINVKIVEAPEAEAEKEAKKVKVRVHSKKYAAVKSKVDKTKKYDLLAAVELVKKLSYTSFDGTITAELAVKEEGITVEVIMPHQAGKTKKVVIVDDKVLADIEAGTIDFDILVSSPQFMPKLAKFARVLGPKGLMPNPKNGTLTPNPERAVKELSAGKQMIKAERKAPLMHVNVGKVSLDSKKIVENVEALLKALKGKVVRMALSASMSPGVKVEIETT